MGTDRRDLEEEPLASFVLKARLAELNLYCVWKNVSYGMTREVRGRLTIRMSDDFGDLCFPAGTDFTVKTLEEIQSTTPEFPAPTFVSNTMSPERFAAQGRERQSGIADEAPRGMGVEAEEEWDEKVMRVPESLVRLLADAVMCGGVHQ